MQNMYLGEYIRNKICNYNLRKSQINSPACRKKLIDLTLKMPIILTGASIFKSKLCYVEKNIDKGKTVHEAN